MKINTESRQNAKRLFRAAFIDGRLDEKRVRELVALIAEKKPRNYIAILSQLRKLVTMEYEAKTVRVESATPLTDKGVSIINDLSNTYGPALATEYFTKPDLIGGLRVQRGSTVWDGSIKNRLLTLQESLD